MVYVTEQHLLVIYANRVIVSAENVMYYVRQLGSWLIK